MTGYSRHFLPFIIVETIHLLLSSSIGTALLLLLLIELFHGKWLFTKSEVVNELSASVYEADFDINLKWLYKS